MTLQHGIASTRRRLAWVRWFAQAGRNNQEAIVLPEQGAAREHRRVLSRKAGARALSHFHLRLDGDCASTRAMR